MLSSQYTECYCDNEYNFQDHYSMILNYTEYCLTQEPDVAKYVIYEIICEHILNLINWINKIS